MKALTFDDLVDITDKTWIESCNRITSQTQNNVKSSVWNKAFSFLIDEMWNNSGFHAKNEIWNHNNWITTQLNVYESINI